MVPMIISCPNCSTTYNVDNATLGPQGKSVRCSNCEQQWHQLPIQEAPVQQTLAYAPQPQKQLEGMIDPTMLQAQIRAQMQAIMATSQMQQPTQMQSAAQPAPEPEPIPESKPMPEPAPDPEEESPSEEDLNDMFGEDEPKPPVSLMSDDNADVDDGFNSLDDIPEPDPIPESLMSQDAYDEDEDEDEDEDKNESGNSIGLILGVVFLMLITGTAVGGFFLRDMVQEMVPQTKPLYEMLGLSDPLGTGLDIQDVRSQRGQEDENDILTVKGNIVNISEKLRMVPLIRISLFNAEDEEVQFINLTPDMAEIPAGEKMNFKGSIINPAPKAKKMEVTFTEPKATEETKK
jgi:predicted Zn finger-like uncharacterized protein